MRPVWRLYMDRLERYPVSFGVKTDRIDDHKGAVDRRGGAFLVEQVSGLVTQFRPGFAEYPFGTLGMAGDDPHREPLRSQMRHDVAAEKPRASENSNSRRAHPRAPIPACAGPACVSCAPAW